ncbi:low molecular weight protein-tyrosine-phosphatase [Paraburkholderia sediminicola]|uniref:low molecular weight protein-tyrosine-phosphatase n=1 Tax=Paraburkholderia sediminicola TaxID=458836 RepID=UPI0038BD7853
MIDSILVVCEGNICRSPMAQGLLKKWLPDATILSAGLGALVGHGADPIAIELLAERGIDIGGHKAASLNLSHVRSVQLVLVMNQIQLKRVEATYPFAKGKVYRLGEHDRTDVIDPFGQGKTVFQAALAQIENGADRWIQAIDRLGK